MGPLFASPAECIDSVRRSVESGTEYSFPMPTIDDGALFREAGLG